MIRYLSGKVLHKDAPNEVIIIVAGVGYLVTVGSHVFNTLQIDQEVEIFTYQHVREDILALYGFLEHHHIRFFTKLLSVSGVGPKSAINIFEVADVNTLVSSIINGDTSLLVKVSGIGKKTAERIILELKNQLVHLPGSMVESIVQHHNSYDDVVAALVNLGYSLSQAEKSVENMPAELENVSDQLTFALKNI